MNDKKSNKALEALLKAPPDSLASRDTFIIKVLQVLYELENQSSTKKIDLNEVANKIKTALENDPNTLAVIKAAAKGEALSSQEETFWVSQISTSDVEKINALFLKYLKDELAKIQK